MQGTVRSFDAVSHCGDLLLDDGSVMTYDAAAFDPSGLRLLRLGQRVRIELDGTGAVGFLTISTLPSTSSLPST